MASGFYAHAQYHKPCPFRTLLVSIDRAEGLRRGLPFLAQLEQLQPAPGGPEELTCGPHLQAVTSFSTWNHLLSVLLTHQYAFQEKAIALKGWGEAILVCVF